jgi:putative hydrolase of the HAD superfamily
MGAPPAAVTFDLHGTLVDDTSRWRNAIDEACAEIAELHDDLDGPALAAANVVAWEEYYPTVELDLMVGRINEEQLGLESWRRSLTECGVADEGIVASARQIFMRHYHASHRLFEDVASTLDGLSKHVALGIVSNAGNETRVNTIERLRIADMCKTVVVSAEVGIAKPDPRIFEIVLTELDLPAQDVWHVGDNPHIDAAGANAAGLTSVWLNRNGRSPKPGQPESDYTIRSLAELHELVR